MSHVIISDTVHNARRFIDLMGIPRDSVRLMSPGSSNTGRLINKITLVGWMPGDGDTPAAQQRSMDWWNCVIRTGLPHDHSQMITYVQSPLVIPVPR